jgi:hypothetical protein
MDSTENASILAPYGIHLVTSSLTGRDNDAGMEEDDPPHHNDSSMHAPDALDATLGMQELKNAVAENQWHTSKSYGQGSFSHSVQIGGVIIKKSHALIQQF